MVNHRLKSSFVYLALNQSSTFSSLSVNLGHAVSELAHQILILIAKVQVNLGICEALPLSHAKTHVPTT